MKRIVFYGIQFIWGLPQNLLGFILLCFYMIFLKPVAIIRYKEAIIIFRKGPTQGMSLGIFIFISGNNQETSVDILKQHEYGHTLQSAVLGPLYLIVIGLPSLLWCNFPPLKRYRVNKHVDYDSFYAERWATYLGENKENVNE